MTPAPAADDDGVVVVVIEIDQLRVSGENCLLAMVVWVRRVNLEDSMWEFMILAKGGVIEPPLRARRMIWSRSGSMKGLSVSYATTRAREMRTLITVGGPESALLHVLIFSHPVQSYIERFH